MEWEACSSVVVLPGRYVEPRDAASEERGLAVYSIGLLRAAVTGSACVREF
jgi:hypothetical protein